MRAVRFGQAAIVLALVLVPAAAWLTAQTKEDFPGVRNFWKIDATASSGGSIVDAAKAVPELKRRGFKSVISLAGGAGAEAEGAAVRAAGMNFFVFAVNPQNIDPALVDPFLKAVTDPANLPAFMHSGMGHRSAMFWMIKRVLVDDWSMEKAGIEAASAGLIDDNDMAPVFWKFIFDYTTAHKKK